MRDLQADLERTKNQTDFIVTVSVPTITEWLERAIEAEAEVEQYHELFTEQTKVIRDIKTENAKLRKVADIAWNVVETRGMSDVLLSELAGRLADWETWKEGAIE